MPVEQTMVPTLQTDGSQPAPAEQVTHAPLLQTIPPPQALPSRALPASTHMETPVAHEVLPLLQGLLTVQATSGVQAPQPPFLQTMLSPQLLPSATRPPVSMHAALPVAQESVPLWHLFVGVQAAPAVQFTHIPSLQTLPVPHGFPFAAGPEATQADAPLVQSILPILQGSLGSHVAPGLQLTHEPSGPQTLPVPHAVAGGKNVPVSLQVGPAAPHSSEPA
jgi:hypothetical protein